MNVQEMLKSSGACAVLLSRNPEMGKAELIQLAELGSATFGVQCDSGDPESLAGVLQWVHESLPSVAVLAHAAGTLGYDTIADVSDDQFWSICNAKVRPSFPGLCNCDIFKVKFKPGSTSVVYPESGNIRHGNCRYLEQMSCAAQARLSAAVTSSPAQPRCGASQEHATTLPPTPTSTLLHTHAGEPLNPYTVLPVHLWQGKGCSNSLNNSKRKRF